MHQLLLWTEARFEYQREDVVRRQQIPMSHDELFADAERFLEETGCRWLAKPFRLRDLLRTAGEMIG